MCTTAECRVISTLLQQLLLNHLNHMRLTILVCSGCVFKAPAQTTKRHTFLRRHLLFAISTLSLATTIIHCGLCCAAVYYLLSCISYRVYSFPYTLSTLLLIFILFFTIHSERQPKNQRLKQQTRRDYKFATNSLQNYKAVLCSRFAVVTVSQCQH